MPPASKTSNGLPRTGRTSAPCSIILPGDNTRLLDPDTLYPNKGPLEVEIGCGKGRFLTARARKNPGTNFLGIDRLLTRLRRTERKAFQEQLCNLRLLRMEASFAIRFLLPPLSVNAFYIFFPDPWPKRRHHERRLLSPSFLGWLWEKTVPGGQIHIATDHAGYIHEVRRAFNNDPRFESVTPFVPAPDEVSEFEQLFVSQGLPIGRFSAAKRPDFIPALAEEAQPGTHDERAYLRRRLLAELVRTAAK